MKNIALDVIVTAVTLQATLAIMMVLRARRIHKLANAIDANTKQIMAALGERRIGHPGNSNN